VIHGVDTSFLVSVEVAGHADHARARELLGQAIDAGDGLALAPQVLAEFIDVVTDARRFAKPLSVPEARDRAERWWRAREVVAAFPAEQAVPLFLAWLREHGLGRKRLLDTLLAATYFSNGIASILTTNARDFRVFGCFVVRQP
jgi:predicted nucleic acid-binding protein